MHVKNQVRVWLNSVDTLLDKDAKIRSKFNNRFKFFGSCSPNLWLRRRTSKLCGKLILQARELKATRDSFQNVADKLTPNHHVKRQSVPTVGMEAMMEQLNSLVEDDEVGIIGIHGMGGIGKTTLLSRYHNEFFASSTHLDVIIWIDVGTNLGIDGIQKAIGMRLGLEWNGDSKSQEERRDILFKILDTMSFALILDNLWERSDLQCIGVPIPLSKSKSKIMLTTRIEEVCDRMRAKKIKVGVLPNDESWQLFQQNLGRDLSIGDSRIHRLAGKFLEICSGMPLAIITVAQTVASKVHYQEWSHAYGVLKNCPYQFPGVEKDVLAPLKLSYDHLPDSRLKDCLLTFCLFPNNLRINKSRLENYWKIDSDITKRSGSYMTVYLLGILRASTLIETSDEFTFISMHPMIRAMVLWTANDGCNQESKCLVQIDNDHKDAMDVEKWRAAHKISIHTGKCALPEAPHCPNLLVLKLQSSSVALKSIPDGFFSFMPCLRLLDLSNSGITELPKQISILVALEYLDLGDTKIARLPKELGELVKLKALRLTGTANLTTIPGGVFAGLTALEMLLINNSYGNWKVGSDGVGVNIQELENLNYLDMLHITVESMPAFEKVTSSPRLNKCSNLIEIRAKDMLSIELPPLTAWSSEMQLCRIRISNSQNLKEIIDYHKCSVSKFSKLELVNLESLVKIKFVQDSWFCYGLVRLNVVQCGKIEQLLVCEGTPTLRNLIDLKIQDLPMLKSLSNQALVFSSLETIEVKECPALKKLNLVAPKLRELKCEKSWWDSLEWDDDDDEAAKSSFESRVQFL